MARKTDEDEFLRLSSSKVIKKQVLERFLQIKKELYNIGEIEFNENYKTATSHDELINICVSAFGPESFCFKELDYIFVSADPLFECNIIYKQSVKNYDVLIYNVKQKHAIFVECKGSISRNGKCISEAYEAIEQVIKNKNYLESKIGDKIISMEFVICLPARFTQNLVSEIEKRELNNIIDKKSPPLLIWQVDIFGGQYLQLFTKINSRDKKFLSQHRDPRLTNLLINSCNVENSEVIFPFYPSSHPLKIYGNIVSSLLNKNRIAGNQNLNEFSLNDVIEYCKLSKNNAHYACDEIGQEMANRFIRDNLAFELIEHNKNKNGFFRLKFESKGFDTLLNNYQKGYRNASIEKIVERKAKKQVVEEFAGKYSNISSFGLND